MLIVSNFEGDVFEISLTELIENINLYKEGNPVDEFNYENFLDLSDYDIVEFL